MRPTSLHVALAAALCAALCGCSALVDPETLLIRCETRDGVDPCAERGLVCSGGTCQPCEPEAETCDGRDNDCDGTIDEVTDPELCDGRDNDCDGMTDEGHDPDGDGYTWCGGGQPELVDCVPDDATIHPTGQASAPGPEPCDGRDNDCDDEVDEDPVCEPTRSCMLGSCGEGLVCDLEQDRCVAPRTRGSSCRNDAECSPGFCVSVDALGLDDVLADGLCGTACCKDSDCDSGGVCVQSGSGARVCLPAEIAGRELQPEGARCVRSSQCASGVCLQGRCVSTCSRDADCDDETCRLNVVSSTLLEGAGAWICGAPGGRDPAGELCTSFDPEACRSALCLRTRCAAPCGSNADCREGFACRYTTVQGLLGAGRVTACLPVVDSEADEAMATCCTAADCTAGETCRPVQVAEHWGMFCQTLTVD